VKVATVGGFGGPIHVFGDESFAKPVAGPFASGAAARLWIVEQIEHKLAPEKLAVWREVAAQLPPLTDCGIELALIGLVARGFTAAQLAKYIPRDLRQGERRALPDRRHEPDHRMAAAGERE